MLAFITDKLMFKALKEQMSAISDQAAKATEQAAKADGEATQALVKIQAIAAEQESNWQQTAAKLEEINKILTQLSEQYNGLRADIAKFQEQKKETAQIEIQKAAVSIAPIPVAAPQDGKPLSRREKIAQAIANEVNRK